MNWDLQLDYPICHFTTDEVMYGIWCKHRPYADSRKIIRLKEGKMEWNTCTI